MFIGNACPCPIAAQPRPSREKEGSVFLHLSREVMPVSSSLVISFEGTGILPRNNGVGEEAVGADRTMRRTRTETGRRGSMKRQAAIWTICFVTTTAGGCVMKSTYDAVIQESEFTRAELEHAKEEQKSLARRVTQLEGQNAETMRDAEAAIAAAQRMKSEAEEQKRTAEEQQARLKQKLAQLAKQQGALRDELAVAKENTAALQEMVEVYQKKVSDLRGAGAASSVPEVARATEPFNPATLPPPEALPVPKPALEAPAPPAATTPATPPPPAPKAPEPEESGWLSTIKGWVVSLWRSVFS